MGDDFRKKCDFLLAESVMKNEKKIVSDVFGSPVVFMGCIWRPGDHL